LGRRSARHEEGAFAIEGPSLVAEALAAGVEVEAVYVGPPARSEVVELAAARGVAVVELADGVVERVATTVSPQPVLAVARLPRWSLDDLSGARFVLVAAGVADPGNLGTIVRVADAAGADGMVLTVGSVDPYNPKVIRASAGSLFHLPVVVDVAPLGLRGLGLPLLATAAEDGIAYDEAALDPPVALVLGNEAHGLPVGLEVDGLVSVPHAGRAESLNVAMAAAVVCFEVARRVRRSAR
jgi:TrmH family RNA methyltransferase